MPSALRLPIVQSESRQARYIPFAERPAGFGLHSLRDKLGRSYTYLRLSVTDRCDFRCEYCMPEGGESEHERRSELLSFEEIERLVGIFATLGIRRVRFTGGEPFVRRGFPELVLRMAHVFPKISFALTTNGGRLAEHAGLLHAAGVESINVSIDSLRPKRFEAITRGGDLARVRKGIETAAELGIKLKLNIVPLRSVNVVSSRELSGKSFAAEGGSPSNEDEWQDLVEYAWDLGAVPRFIELMPLGEGKKIEDRRVSCAEVIESLGLAAATREAPMANRGPARYLRGERGVVGFISPLSNTFCEDCNRLRVNARGDIRACLADRQAVSLRDILRNGGDDSDVAWALHQALRAKQDGHAFNDLLAREHENVGMSLIGG